MDRGQPVLVMAVDGDPVALRLMLEQRHGLFHRLVDVGPRLLAVLHPREPEQPARDRAGAAELGADLADRLAIVTEVARRRPAVPRP
ncbi:MAG: hypothetical protein MZV65_17995 [Chromatiales bacterium]|nr:hypothetical protein [Chromatiales bacterium]